MGNVRKEDEDEVECVRRDGKERRRGMKKMNATKRVFARACVRGSWGLGVVAALKHRLSGMEQTTGPTLSVQQQQSEVEKNPAWLGEGVKIIAAKS